MPGTATTLSSTELAALSRALTLANKSFAERYPGDASTRQPVHTVYGGAQLFRAETTGRLGQIAVEAFRDYAPNPQILAKVLGIEDAALAKVVHARVAERLWREPVEDFRIDFEDGYGVRPDGEEDAQAEAVGGELARGMSEKKLPAFIGFRVKPLNEELRARSVRTLDIVITTLVRATGSQLPQGFVITLPKVTVAEQVAHFARVLERLERRLHLDIGALRFEVMVETPQVIVDSSGASPLPRIITAGGGRVSAAHFGTYDYTAGLGITAAYQTMQHPLCDFAKQVMQVVLAGTGVWLSDGSTTVLPVAPHRAAKGGTLTAEQIAENRAVVHHAWRLHYDDIQHSLRGGFYQGWDLHPAQIPTRYAALFTFFLSGVDAAAARLRNFLDKAAQATLIGDVFDDAATGQGLLNFFLRGINSGALTEEEVVARTGVPLEELRERSFQKILRRRGGTAAASEENEAANVDLGPADS
jgi:citrate lyase beta subunit